jgi:hypothetical protein
VVAESLLAEQQLLILNRSRRRSPNLRVSDRIIAGLMRALDPASAPDAVCHRPEAVNSAASPRRAGGTKVPHVVFAQA